MRYPAAMRLSDCHAIADFRRLAKRRLPWPVFDYIDGGADDEATLARNTAAFASADLVPNVLAGVAEIDTSVTILGRRSALPLILSPTALQRVFHWQGERAVARAAEKFGLWCGISSLATVSIEEIGALISSPKLFQLYVHKDKGLNAALIQRARAAKFDALALTVDSIVSGNRQRCARSGFTSPPRLPPPRSATPSSPAGRSTTSSAKNSASPTSTATPPRAPASPSPSPTTSTRCWTPPSPGKPPSRSGKTGAAPSCSRAS